MKKTLVFAAVVALAGLAQADYTYVENGPYGNKLDTGTFNFGEGYNKGGIWSFANDSFVSFEGWDVYCLAFQNSSKVMSLDSWKDMVTGSFAQDSQLTKVDFLSIVNTYNKAPDNQYAYAGKQIATVKDGKMTEIRKGTAEAGEWVANSTINNLALVIANTGAVGDDDNVLFATFVFVPNIDTEANPHDFTYTDVGFTTTNVPEPTSGLLLLLGMAGLALKRKHV